MKRAVFSVLSSFVFVWQAQAANYKIDPAHSDVGFTVKHLMVSKVRGQFNKFDGTFDFDEKKKEVNKINVTVDANSIDTNDAKRDEHLQSPDFFDVKKNPKIVFKADKVSVKEGQTTKVSGQLTMRGVTKPITLDLTYGGTMKDAWGNERLAFALVGQINRKDWGINWNKALDKGGVTVSDEVSIEINGQAIKAK